MRHPKSGAAIAAAALITVVGLVAQQAPGPNLEVLQIRPNFYMIAGAGSNIGVQAGEDGVVVVDSGSASSADAVIAAIKKITARPIRYVINTSADTDHVGGNAAVAKAGQTLFTGNGGAGIAADFLGGAASILSVEQVLTRMSATGAQAPRFPLEAWPTETFNQPRKYMYLNGEGIEIFHEPAAHTDGDAIVFFRRSDVIVAGDIVDTTRFPVIDIAKGGSIRGEIAGLQKLVDTAIPSVPIVSREAGTLIIPGHGRVCDQLDVVEYRDMVTIIRDRIRDLMKQGRSWEQIQAAAPARGYQHRYGSDAGSWTTNNFVEAVYRSMDQKRKMRVFLIAALITLSIAVPQRAAAQQRGAPTSAATTPKTSAPMDLTGYWVAFVTEDWRFRMVTPRKGDYQSVPMTEQARKVADAWNPQTDEAAGNQCKAYGGAAIMRLPARFHITWQDDNTLRVDTDSGMQTRLFHFNPQPSRLGERTWQGYSTAQWQAPASLKIATTNLRSGYLRKNGVPYSENAAVTEYFDTAPLPNGGEVLLVTTIVDDPQYLRQPFMVSSQFKKEADGSKWDPTPCTAE